MKIDKIVKNAKVFTANKELPFATALVVKDGKFAYVGDEAGLANFEGEVCDLDGRFVMPAIIDSHVHVTMGAAFEYTDMGDAHPVLKQGGGPGVYGGTYLKQHRPEVLPVCVGAEVPERRGHRKGGSRRDLPGRRYRHHGRGSA